MPLRCGFLIATARRVSWALVGSSVRTTCHSATSSRCPVIFYGASKLDQVVCLSTSFDVSVSRAKAVFDQWFGDHGDASDNHLERFKQDLRAVKSYKAAGFSATLARSALGVYLGEDLWLVPDLFNPQKKFILSLLKVNYDHFRTSPDGCALTAWQAFHFLAQQVAAGNVTTYCNEDNTDEFCALRMAYAIDAFGAHFLTDAFAAGHMRVPRNVSLYTACDNPLDFGPAKGLRAGLSVNMMHNEDNYNGLEVDSGDILYGDDRLADFEVSLTSIIGRRLQLSANDVARAYRTKAAANVNASTLLGKIPSALAPTLANGNTCPMLSLVNDTIVFRDSLFPDASGKCTTRQHIYDDCPTWSIDLNASTVGMFYNISATNPSPKRKGIGTFVSVKLPFDYAGEIRKLVEAKATVNIASQPEAAIRYFSQLISRAETDVAYCSTLQRLFSHFWNVAPSSAKRLVQNFPETVTRKWRDLKSCSVDVSLLLQPTTNCTNIANVLQILSPTPRDLNPNSDVCDSYVNVAQVPVPVPTPTPSPPATPMVTANPDSDSTDYSDWLLAVIIIMILGFIIVIGIQLVMCRKERKLQLLADNQ